jgi:thymidine kinase
MESDDSSSQIRKLLKIGSPTQKLIDSLDSPLFGNLMLLSGSSNSGKTEVALKLLENFTGKENKCSYFDLENSFDALTSTNEFPDLKLDNVTRFPQRSERFYNLKDLSFIIKRNLKENSAKIFFIDYIQLVPNYDRIEDLKELKDFVKENNLLGIIILNESKDKDFQQNKNNPFFSDFCQYHLRTSKKFSLNGNIDVSVVKNNFSMICNSFTLHAI